MYLKGGYKTISLSNLLTLSNLYDEKRLTLGALRVYMALQEMKAIRVASNSEHVLYTREEIIRLTGLSLRSIGKALSLLKNEALITFTKKEITFLEPAFTHQEFSLKELKRFTPVPRRYLRLLAKETRVSTLKTLLAYVVRGLYLRRGEVNNKGTVKASWIARIFNLSLRAVKMARSVLYRIGIIKKDTTSYQRKLNRTGHYFILQTELSDKGELPGTPEDSPPVLRGNKGSRESLKREGGQIATQAGSREKNLSRTHFAPPKAQKCTNFAPPYKDKKSSYEVKTRKSGSGVFTNREGEPDLRDVTLMDIKKPSRLLSLYKQATEGGLLPSSENNLLNFFAAAIRAGTSDFSDDRKIRVFLGIVRKGLWGHITQAQEEQARKAIRKIREF